MAPHGPPSIPQLEGGVWRQLDTGACAPALNMAWDEVLLDHIANIGCPVLRFYAWSEPAATFGYFQRMEEVKRLTALRPLIRRPTGGGLVPHEADWTYSLVFPTSHPWYHLRARSSYRAVHEWLRTAFSGLGCATTLAAQPLPGRVGQCFAGAEESDLLRAGTKLAGAAQRRTRGGLLIQGSVQPQPGAPLRAAWQDGMREAARRDWGVTWHPLAPDTALAAAARALAATKYANADYNCRR